MSTSSQHKKHVEILGLFGIGIFLLAIAMFFDPIGVSPDTGVLDLASAEAKRLLGAFGALFVIGGLVSLIKSRSSGSR